METRLKVYQKTENGLQLVVLEPVNSIWWNKWARLVQVFEQYGKSHFPTATLFVQKWPGFPNVDHSGRWPAGAANPNQYASLSLDTNDAIRCRLNPNIIESIHTSLDNEDWVMASPGPGYGNPLAVFVQ